MEADIKTWLIIHIPKVSVCRVAASPYHRPEMKLRKEIRSINYMPVDSRQRTECGSVDFLPMADIRLIHIIFDTI